MCSSSSELPGTPYIPFEENGGIIAEQDGIEQNLISLQSQKKCIAAPDFANKFN